MNRIHVGLWAAALSILAALACDGDATGPLDFGPMAVHYPFEGDARDASGNGHNAVVVGAIPTTDRFSRPAGAYAFDGVDDHMLTQATFDFAPRTVAFWFRLREHLGRYQRILVQNSDQLEYGAFGLGITTDSLFEGRAGGNGTFVIGNTKVLEGRWYHVVLVRDASQEMYYVDGALVATSAGSSGGSLSNTTNLLIGTTRIFDRFFAGALDDVRIYEVALTAEQVARLFEAAAGS